MDTLKNILNIILLTTYLFQKTFSSPRNVIIPDLNDVTDEARKEKDRCISIIYSELKCKRPANTRYDIPKQVFGTITVNDLKRREAQKYFEYLHDKIIPITLNLKQSTMLTPVQYCQRFSTGKIHYLIHPSLQNINCITRLSHKFPITDNLTQILQHTFNYFVLTDLHRDDYASYYYNKIVPYLGFDEFLMTPDEYCKSLTEDHVITPNKKQGSDDPGASSSSPKLKKIGFYSTGKGLYYLTNLQA